MKFVARFAALLSLAAAAPQAPSPLDVKLEMADNSAVKATITNNGRTDLRVLKTGTILDKSPIQKAHVMSHGGNEVQFHGIRQRIATQGLDDAAFEHIPAGQSVEVVFNVGQVHNLSAGGTFNIHSSGMMQFANQHDNELVGAFPYASNNLTAKIDGAEAASALKSFRVSKRSVVKRDCRGRKLSAVRMALANCVKLATGARMEVLFRRGRMLEYFKDESLGVRFAVADVFRRVAAECSSGTNGASATYCTDIDSGCSEGVLAYTVPSESYQVYCDSYFEMLPASTSRCHGQDQGSTTLHEMTHLEEVAGTSDLGYGYKNAMVLDTDETLNNADTYSLFANAVQAIC